MDLLLPILAVLLGSGVLLVLAKKLLSYLADKARESENKIDDLLIPLEPFLEKEIERRLADLKEKLDKDLAEKNKEEEK